MIEIIKRGTKIVTECKKCGCEFSFESEDVQRKYSFIDNPKKYGEYVMCPQCNKEVVVCQTK